LFTSSVLLPFRNAIKYSVDNLALIYITVRISIDSTMSRNLPEYNSGRVTLACDKIGEKEYFLFGIPAIIPTL